MSVRRSTKEKRIDSLVDQIEAAQAADRAAGIVYAVPGQEVFNDLARIMGPGLRKIHERNLQRASG